MTVQNTANVAQFNGDGTNKAFPFTFRFFKNTDLVVIKTNAGGTVTPLNLNVDYSVSGAGSLFGGTVTTTAAPLAGETLMIMRELDLVQLTDLRNQGRFYPEVHENVFDYLTMLLQQISESNGRALRRPRGKQDFDAEGRRITNLQDARSGSDAATLNNVTSAVNSAVRAEEDARAAADANIQQQLGGQIPLESSAFSPISWHDQEISNSVNIPAGVNAWSFGPEIQIDQGQIITIGEGSSWTVADGEEQQDTGTENWEGTRGNAVPVDDRTPNLNLPLPNANNQLSDDVGRLRDALGGLDVLGGPDGASMIGFPIMGGGNSRRMLADRILDYASAKDYAIGDGITDDTEALQKWANCGAKLLLWPEGKYRVTPAKGVALDVGNYAYGDGALLACIKFPAGVTVETAGTATQLIVDTPSSTTCAIAVDADTGGSPSTHSQITTRIGRIMLRAVGAHGRYGVITPANSTILYNKRPRYDIDVHFAPPPGQDAFTISPYGWDVGILIGDSVDGKINYSGYGTYNASIANEGQHQMYGCRVYAVNGAYGLTIRFQCANMYKFFDAPKSLEGFDLLASEGLGCWIGVTIDSQSGNPGGFIDAIHINTNNTGYEINNRSSLQIGRIEAYRSDGFHKNGLDWTALKITNSPKVSVGSLHALPGTLHAKTDNVALRADTSTFTIENIQAEFLNNLVKANNCRASKVGDVVVNTTDTLYNLSGASMLDFKAGEVLKRSGTTKYLVTDGTVDKKRLRFPNESLLSVRKFQSISVSAAGSTTVINRETATTLAITMQAGTAAFTYDIALDRVGAVPGDTVRIKIIGSASANPTVRVLDGVGGNVLSTFNNIGASKRLLCDYVAVESGVNAVWTELSIADSLESSY